LPALLATEEAHILNVCSILGLVAIPKFTAYQTSKFGLVGFSESLRAEYTCRGLGVTALCPGFVRTNIYQAMLEGAGARPMRSPPRWFYASPELVAARAIKAIRRNQGVVTLTLLARLMWFVKRLAPRLWAFAVRARKKSVKPENILEQGKTGRDAQDARHESVSAGLSGGCGSPVMSRADLPRVT
jgi:short-subunit dehydrogenase